MKDPKNVPEIDGKLLDAARSKNDRSPWIIYGVGQKVVSIANKLPAAESIMADVEELGSPLEMSEFRTLVTPPSVLESCSPAMPIKATHVVQLAAAGMLNGQKMELDGEEWLVSGTTERYIVKTKEEIEDENGSTSKVTESERIAYQITRLSMKTGQVDVIDSRDREKYEMFISGNVQALIDAANVTNPPRYKMDYSKLIPLYDKLHAPGKLPGLEENGLLTAQKHVCAAQVSVLKKYRCGVIVGECGTGKTITALSAVAIATRMIEGKIAKIVVVCPAVVAPKWVREAKAILKDIKGLKVKLIGDGNGERGKPILDAIEMMEYDGPAVLVSTYETAKNGAPWEHAVAWRKRQIVKNEKNSKTGKKEEVKIVINVPVCPMCGVELKNNEGQLWNEARELIPLKDPDQKRRSKRTKQTCPKCGEQLWRSIGFNYGGRWPVADFIAAKYSGDYGLIVDEAHQTAGATTDQGLAAADLIFNARYVIAMTGTIFNGLASSLFSLLYRLSNDFRNLYKHNEVSAFIQHHGLIETITTVRHGKTHGYSGYGRDNESKRTRERPGVTPSMCAMLMPFTTFLTLDDLGIELPPKVECAVPVQICDEMSIGLRDLKSVYTEGKRALAASNGRNKGPYLRWFNAALAWPDCPLDEVIKISDDHSVGITGVGTVCQEVGLPKDIVLKDLILENLAEGRGVGVFFEQVLRRSAIPRVEKLLAKEGVYTAILTTSIPPKERMPWIEEQVEKANKKKKLLVLLGNGDLIKEGVDLLMFPTLIEIGQHYRINDLRQRLNRSHRLGQTKDVRIYFLYYEDTMQETALKYIALKLRAALQIEGKVAAGLSEFDMDADFAQDLMKAAEQLNGVKLSEMMQTRAPGDIHAHRVIQVVEQSEKVRVIVPVSRVDVDCDWNALFKKAAEVGKRKGRLTEIQSSLF